MNCVKDVQKLRTTRGQLVGLSNLTTATQLFLGFKTPQSKHLSSAFTQPLIFSTQASTPGDQDLSTLSTGPTTTTNLNKGINI